MAFCHPNGYYYCELTIPGYGQLPRLSLGTKRKTEARRMEEAIRAVGREALTRPALHTLLDALRPQGKGTRGRLSAADLLVARSRSLRVGAAAFDDLLRRLDDPPLDEVLEAYRKAVGHNRADGFADMTLRKYTGPLRLSHVSTGAGVERLLEQIAAGETKLRSSVRRYEQRLLSKVLTWRLGKAARNTIFAEVTFEVEQEKRLLIEEEVTAERLSRLVEELGAGYYKAGDEWAPLLVQIALRTGATISPLSNAKREALTLVEREDKDGKKQTWGHLYLSGTKATAAGGRDRPIWLLPRQVAQLRLGALAAGDELFPILYSRFATMWRKAVVRAGLGRAVVQSATKKRVPLRPHDCRRIYAMMAGRAGLDQVKVSKAGLGHKSFQMTAHYQDRVTQFTPEEMRAIDAVYVG